MRFAITILQTTDDRQQTEVRVRTNGYDPESRHVKARCALSARWTHLSSELELLIQLGSSPDNLFEQSVRALESQLVSQSVIQSVSQPASQSQSVSQSVSRTEGILKR